ncbi:hypothetical protein AXF14_12490 [Actinomyces radicidentis]|uniref:Alpha/beta hydrolase fold-3 domain-containing protein n=1 Tax=Actinomyces radicidentis TaxID=111015 RepID=A0A120KLH0_ACTRD|nr:alpha/beta hydrolase [Actinomyces radicidentis]AMD88246.1 hypothetical protein AXF14_12490 [Actinomyces radicidentis]
MSAVAGPEWFDAHLDPAYRAALDAFETLVPSSIDDLDAEGRRAAQATTFLPEPEWVAERVTWHDVWVPSPDPGREVRLRVYQPRTGEHERPAVLCVHGGGMWAGTIESEHTIFAGIADRNDAVCVSVDYRLAPEHPFPAGLDDVMVGLRWLANEACALRVDPARIALYGGSAGGGLVLGAALRSRDEGGPSVCFVQALYPMIDDTSSTPSSYQVIRHGAGVWSRANNVEGWGWYLDGQDPSIYAAPARASVDQLRGLSPVYLDVGELDLFRDEDLALAARLSAAGVPVELHLTPGLFHGAENVAPDARASERIFSYRYAAMARHLGR